MKIGASFLNQSQSVVMQNQGNDEVLSINTQVKLLYCNVVVVLFSVLWLEVETQQNSRRVTVIGCQNGHVKVAVTELTEGPSMNLSQG